MRLPRGPSKMTTGSYDREDDYGEKGEEKGE
jgi:hypothetical protein